MDMLWNTAIVSTALVIVMLFGDILINGEESASEGYRVVGGLSIVVALISWILWIVGSLII